MAYLGKKRFQQFAAAFLLVWSFCAANTQAQVSIAPTSLFFDNQSRFSSLTISNGGNEAQEISISMEFGYPTTKNGNLVIANDSALAQEKSMAEWIKVFPQSFTLQGQQRQVVRFVARPPQGLEPGGYWSRIRISSNPVSPPIESVQNNRVGAQINVIINQVIAAYYLTEGATTKLDITSVDFTQNGNAGSIAISMEQTGNSPFVGSIDLKVTSEEGNTIYQTATTNSVYTTITRKFNIDLSNVEPGNYTISGVITSQRNDISQDKLLQIEPVTFQKEITIK